MPSVRFLILIFAFNASEALFDRNKPNPTPPLFPERLNGAKWSKVSSTPTPSSATSMQRPSFVW